MKLNSLHMNYKEMWAVFWNKWCQQILEYNPCLPNAEVKLLAVLQQPVLRIRSIIVNLFFCSGIPS